MTRVETKVIAIPSCGIAADTTCSVLRKTGSWWLRAWDTSTVDRATAEVMLDRLHAAQNAFYSGGDDQKLRALLDPDIIWTVPGSSPIAGRYHGIDEVFAYFAHRRDRAAGTFRMHRRDVFVGECARIAALTTGRRRSPALSTRGRRSGFTRPSMRDVSAHAGCYRSTRPRLTRSGRADAAHRDGLP